MSDSYNVQLSERQRQFLIQLFEASNLAIDPNDDELASLEGMLIGLPEVEKENPKVLHGFAL